MKWISVKDVLPAKPKRVLVFAINGNHRSTETMVISGADPLKPICIDDNHLGLRAKLWITHWMPLPDPPNC